ncbi:NUDIX domain-containing protein [Corynebacterium testudinoris]|uniref:NUDIX domain-containing protein n=1 Tax=Corynebacterium testudinoris TaxID=136857 RepID=UPI0006411113|nr:NUDIX hydrolase [Corynebacterium testudinoris]
MEGDGNGWAAGPAGVRVWGRFGAAGLMLLAGSGEDRRVLMQHRAQWTNQGGTWALPGGARDSHETAVEAALREAMEETAVDPSLVEVLYTEVTAGPYPGDQWTYTTVIAQTVTGEPLPVDPNEESLELRWVPLGALDTLPLMPAFESALPGLLQAIHRISS